MLRPVCPKVWTWKFQLSPFVRSSAKLYNHSDEKWRLVPQARTKSTVPHPLNFQVVSYNVWFRSIHEKKRMEAIAKELDSCENLVFVGFQELTDSLTDYIKFHFEKDYRFCLQPRDRPHGVGLALRKDFPIIESKFLPYKKSLQGRGLLYVQTPTMLLATTHLESVDFARIYDSVEQREEQIVEATTFCEDQLRDNPQLQLAVIVGDFNWDDERVRCKPHNQPLLQLIKSDWRDAGTYRDYTYDTKENPMLRGQLRLRLDRCIYMTQKNHETKTHLKKLGMSAIPDLTWVKTNPYNGTIRLAQVAPSDHFGLAITFEMNP